MEPSEHARAAAPGAAGDPMVGRLLDGRYRILARVARGGMASVYEATDTRLDRTVAVKVMHPGLAGTVEVALSDLRALAREGLLRIDHEDSMFGMIDVTPEGARAADALGHE